jgi:hypothetical protein
MIRSFTLRIRLATSSSRASAPVERVERERLVLLERERLVELFDRVLRLVLDFAPPRELPLLRLVPLDRPLELDLLEPPLLACGMLPPLDWTCDWRHPTFTRARVCKCVACDWARGRRWCVAFSS